MTLLSRYVLRQNLFLLLLICGVGLGIYIFIDLFDRLDDFVDAKVGLWTVATYFFYRLPSILAQIFPAVFLLAAMVQLGIMLRNRELLALEACSVSPGAVARSVLYYALALCLAQLLLSEVLGAYGHRAAERIWSEEVRSRAIATRQLHNIWFREGNRIVNITAATPLQGRGQGLTIHTLDPSNTGRIVEIVRAGAFTVSPKGWLLEDASRLLPDSFAVQNASQLLVQFQTDLGGFLVIDPKTKLESLPLWQLGSEMERLRQAGSNIERLQTAWHMKLAYAASLLVMALIALATVSMFGSLFVIIPVGLVTTFCYYGLFVFSASAGENGLLPPIVAAWSANMIFALLAGARVMMGRSFHGG